MTESMEDAEMEQRRIDRFWGLDLEVSNRRKEVAFMNREELLSIGQERLRKTQADQSLWEIEMKEQEDAETISHARNEVFERKKYLKTLYNSDNASQAIIDYCWSSRVCVPSNTDAMTSALRRRELKVSYDAMHQQVAQQLPGTQFESPSIHGGKVTGSLDKQYFDDDDFHHQQPQEKDLMGSSYASPKHMLMLSRILESSDDILSNEGGDEADPTDDRIWGHRDFKWNQLQMLESLFHKLVLCSESATIDDSSEPALRVDMGQSLGNVLKQAFQKLDGATQCMISYTVFGSWIKRNKWEMFSELCSADDGSVCVFTFTVVDWLDLATLAAFETKISRSDVRTNKEHCDFVRLETKLCRRRVTGSGLPQSTESSVLWPPSTPNHNQLSSSESSIRGPMDRGGDDSDYARWFAAMSRAHLDGPQRGARIARQLAIGDLVWCQVRLFLQSYRYQCGWLVAGSWGRISCFVVMAKKILSSFRLFSSLHCFCTDGSFRTFRRSTAWVFAGYPPLSLERACQ